jgi:hypothetical protein
VLTMLLRMAKLKGEDSLWNPTDNECEVQFDSIKCRNIVICQPKSKLCRHGMKHLFYKVCVQAHSMDFIFQCNKHEWVTHHDKLPSNEKRYSK